MYLSSSLYFSRSHPMPSDPPWALKTPHSHPFIPVLLLLLLVSRTVTSSPTTLVLGVGWVGVRGEGYSSRPACCLAYLHTKWTTQVSHSLPLPYASTSLCIPLSIFPLTLALQKRFLFLLLFHSRSLFQTRFVLLRHPDSHSYLLLNGTRNVGYNNNNSAIVHFLRACVCSAPKTFCVKKRRNALVQSSP